ncbi:MAG: primosomal protein N' [Bacteroidia bacterium]|nr:primosomal protein N' [Bacteroidia bacterium]
MADKKIYADVIIPVSLPMLFTYSVPDNFRDEIMVGKRVVVQFGKQKIYSALVKKIHLHPPAAYETKEILSVLDERVIVNDHQLQLWEWLASYYMCTLGEVLNTALPPAFKLQSESKITLNPGKEFSHSELGDKEFLIIQALELQPELSMKEVSQILHLKSPHRIVKSLVDKEIILVEEEIHERLKPVKIKMIRLAQNYSESETKKIFDGLEKKSPAQLEVLMTFFRITQQENKDAVSRAELTNESGKSSSVISQLIKKNILAEFEEVKGLPDNFHDEIFPVAKLNEMQGSAYENIRQQFSEHEVVLLHGVTSSGKTEIYIHLIEEIIKQGKQVLYLLPEIALTTQIISRLKKHFGSKIGVYHSRLNSRERVNVWKQMLDDSGQESLSVPVILGARSSLFLPFDNLGLVIVDEEHENSFKQFERSPLYHARDSAIMLASFFKAKTLLGSATPSFETFFNTKQNKYGYVSLNERYGGMLMPVIEVVDVKEQKRTKKMKSHFSVELLDDITSALEKNEQVILFQNRRGFAPLLICSVCAWTPRCKNCDVGMTYHKRSDIMRCHYCGSTQKVPTSCPACGSTALKIYGFGTEKIEEELLIFFPDKNIARLDLDTTRSRNAFRQIIEDFENRRIDILVGTQMVTKGLDFDNVSTVGILNADLMLNFPDFRSHERSYQLMAQVSGRSGRKNKRGKVVIQTFQPQHRVIQNVVSNNYEAMYESEMLERKKFNYPPFFRLIEITLRHRNEELVSKAARTFASMLREKLKTSVLGPEPPVVARVKNEWRQNILIKVNRNNSVGSAKEFISKTKNIFLGRAEYHRIAMDIDVDPM